MEFDIDGEKKPSKPPPPFVEMLHNKQYVFILVDFVLNIFLKDFSFKTSF